MSLSDEAMIFPLQTFQTPDNIWFLLKKNTKFTYISDTKINYGFQNSFDTEWL